VASNIIFVPFLLLPLSGRTQLSFSPHFETPRGVVDLQQLISYSSEQPLVPVHVLTLHGKGLETRSEHGQCAAASLQRIERCSAAAFMLAPSRYCTGASSLPQLIRDLNLTLIGDGVSWARQSIRPLPDTQHHDFFFFSLQRTHPPKPLLLANLRVRHRRSSSRTVPRFISCTN
jgi:hypothetical protein